MGRHAIQGHQWNTGVPPVLAGGHPDRCKLLLAGRQQPSTAGTAVFRSLNMRSHHIEEAELRSVEMDADPNLEITYLGNLRRGNCDPSKDR